MPSVEFSINDMESLLGRRIPHDTEGLNELMGYVKADVETFEDDRVTIGVKDSNRPDIWSPEGIARALRGYLGIRTQTKLRLEGKSGFNVTIDKRLKNIRPFISAAIVKGLSPSDNILKGWINLQEKLDQTYGRQRKKASIGFYQADLVKSPLSYTVADPDTTRFTPLGMERELSLREILLTHPKGVEYGDTISGFEKYPILIDGAGSILSLPPIINSNDIGRTTPDTKNLLVEVTGIQAETVDNTLKIVVSTLAERGGKIYSCKETYQREKDPTVYTPNLSPTDGKIGLAFINKLLGTEFHLKEAVQLIERAGYRVTATSNEEIKLEIPFYRIDIMHPVDIVEDIAIASNVNQLKPEWPRIWTIGGLTETTRKTESAEEIMIGLGFQQVLTYALNSPLVINENMHTSDPFVEIANPRLSTHTALRPFLLPSLFEFLSDNTHVEYPQQIFEIGRCISHNGSTIAETDRLAAVTIGTSAGFTQIRSSFDALARNMGAAFHVDTREHPSFLLGRCGSVRLKNVEVGIIGETNPSVLRAWGLGLPAAAFEIDLGSLFPVDQETKVANQ